MNFRNLVLFFFLVIFLISPIGILCELESNFKEIEPGGKFGNNKKRKLADSNYITVKYYTKTEYTAFGTNRYGIDHIISEGQTYSKTDSFTIQANNSIEIHFASPVNRLNLFFSIDTDPNVVNIISIDFSKFDSSLVTNMGYMLYGCNQLNSVDFSNFKTSLVTNMGYMLYGCNKLKSVDLSSFDTSSVTNMQEMFYANEQLESLNLSNFNTKSVRTMYRMFFGCELLKSFDISNFDTSLVTNMAGMFYNCKKLESLDISNFNTSSVTNTQTMFDGLDSINYINLTNIIDNNQLKTALSQATKVVASILK